MTRRYDYIVVGGGSSGCVAATRLVRDHGYRVLLLERGPPRAILAAGLPAGYLKFLARDDYLEMHETVPQPQLGGRAPIVPQAKLLGGGRCVNAMVYMRGQREDYDGWDAFLGGDSGWAYDDLLPHFRGMEGNQRFGGPFHGSDGPLRVSDPGYTCAMSQKFIAAAMNCGLPFNPDFNGARQNGVGSMQMTIGDHARCSAVRAFLSQVRSDPRLTLVTGAVATRILTERGRAVGVEYLKDGQRISAYAEAEVLVATGTYNTAKLLMLSGLGPADELRAHGIDVVADLPGVGANLQDHHEVPVISRVNGAYGYWRQDRGWRMLRNGLQYLLFRSGPVTTIGFEACAFLDPDGGERPTIQLYCAPIVYLDRDVAGDTDTHGVTLTCCLLRPKARGTVRLRSADPLAKPLVDCRFFAEPDDLRLSIAALRWARGLLATNPCGPVMGDEIMPGKDAVDDAALQAHCNRTVKTNYHPVGTARMGPDGDPMAVLDKKLRVRGIEALRVIDCSAVPMIPSANTNAIALVLGDRAVTLITGDRRAGAG